MTMPPSQAAMALARWNAAWFIAADRLGASWDLRYRRICRAVVFIEPETPMRQRAMIATAEIWVKAPKAARTRAERIMPPVAERSMDLSTRGPAMSEPAVMPSP